MIQNNQLLSTSGSNVKPTDVVSSDKSYKKRKRKLRVLQKYDKKELQYRSLNTESTNAYKSNLHLKFKTPKQLLWHNGVIKYQTNIVKELVFLNSKPTTTK